MTTGQPMAGRAAQLAGVPVVALQQAATLPEVRPVEAQQQAATLPEVRSVEARQQAATLPEVRSVEARQQAATLPEVRPVEATPVAQQQAVRLAPRAARQAVLRPGAVASAPRGSVGMPT